MGKGEEISTTKYLIHAQINANGIVEKPDVVGAIFGQTEGLLSNDLDLRELKKPEESVELKLTSTPRPADPKEKSSYHPASTGWKPQSWRHHWRP